MKERNPRSRKVEKKSSWEQQRNRKRNLEPSHYQQSMDLLKKGYLLIFFIDCHVFQAVNSTHFGYYYGYTWVSGVRCNGNETTLLNCTHNNNTCDQRTLNYAVAACSKIPIDDRKC